MVRTIAWSTAFLVALTGAAAFADIDPVAVAPSASPAIGGTSPWAERRAVAALRTAYHAIAEAQALGASTYLDAAKAHYRGALARYGRHDIGAASEAMAATSLTVAAMLEHPAPAPRDLPAPPAILAVPATVPERLGPARDQPSRATRLPMRGVRLERRFDPTRVAADAQLVGTPEAKQFAQRALDSDLARTRAAFTGNPDEALQAGRLADTLARAVAALARADHPPAAMQRGNARPHRSSGDSVVGGADPG